jgi:ribosomal protein L11 methyltransferase
MHKNYLQLQVSNINSDQAEILIAQLSELGFDGFEETADSLSAFINETDFDESAVNELFDTTDLSYTKSIIAATNWNESWEKNFDPVIVEDFAAVRAHFHAPINSVQHEIIITPKMSFGTGHHATTYMMMQQMSHINFSDKTVFDFGTGTGILAILAEKLGATDIYAIDNDEWSIENARENMEKNDCSHITLALRDEPGSPKKFDIILANINKHVILAYMANIIDNLSTNGLLLVSGLLAEDEADILKAVSNLHITHLKTVSKEKWLCMLFTV